MDEFRNIQKAIFENKLKKGFNTTNVELEFCFTNDGWKCDYKAYLNII